MSGLTSGLANGVGIRIDDWDDLRALPSAMDDLGAQGDEIVRYARTWVCQRRGFEASEVCVLRPLGQAMELLAEAFGAAGREFADQWAEVRDAVVATTADLERHDDQVAATVAGLGRSLAAYRPGA